MKKNLIGFCAILILLCSCGPTIREAYNYTPPDESGGKNCVAECHIQKQKCEQKAEYNYQKCVADNADVVIYNSKSGEYGRYSKPTVSCRRYDCVQSYNECFELCGGTVESYLYEDKGSIF